MAHRGGAGHRPENTLAAIEYALELGVDVIEVDVRCSGDGRLILLHDDDLDRTTSGVGSAGSMPAQDLARIDAGSHFASRFSDQGIPSLEAAVDLVGDRAQWDFDLKDRAAVAPLIRLIGRFGMRERCWLTGMRIEDARQLAPTRLRTLPILFADSADAAAAVSPDALAGTAAELEDARACGLNVDHHLIEGPAIADALARRHLALWTFTVNRSERYRELLALGVQAICSDFPGEMHSASTESKSGR